MISGEAFAKGEAGELVAGMVIRFGPGVHHLDERAFRGADGDSLPADITVIGAGMDATLLALGDISIDSVVERLAFRNMTLDCENNGLFDLRNESMLLDLERVRIVRFDAGHGGCKIFGVTRGSVLRARDCQIVGGYGRSPGNGDIFRRGPVIARFENCHFELVDDWPRLKNSRIHYKGCTFALLRKNPADYPVDGELYENCSFSDPLGSPAAEARMNKKLSDLFWQFEGK